MRSLSGFASSGIGIVVVFVGSLLTVGAGAFYVGNKLVAPRDIETPPPAEILDEARKRVPIPVLPPKPAGREVVEKVETPVEVNFPIVKNEMRNFGLGVKVAVPVMSTEKRTIMVKTDKRTLVDATPEQIKTWEAEVARIQSAYDGRVKLEAAAIVKRQQDENAKKVVQETTAMIRESITPLVISLAGLVGAIGSLWGALKWRGASRDGEKTESKGAVRRRR